MTKKNFLFLVLTVVGGLLFALGMCMCLLPEWNAFGPGVVYSGNRLEGRGSAGAALEGCPY